MNKRKCTFFFIKCIFHSNYILELKCLHFEWHLFNLYIGSYNIEWLSGDSILIVLNTIVTCES